MTKILLVEDEESFREGLSFILSKEGYAVTQFEQHGADLVLLDVMLPGLSGLEVCKKLRNMTKVPIIMLTAKDTELDKVLGLEIGADDYITKPFSSRELLARVKALLRRIQRDKKEELNLDLSNEILHSGDITLIPESREAQLGNKVLRFTPIEFEILHCLMQNLGKTVSPQQLLHDIWGYSPDDDIETIRVHIRHLRQRIESEEAIAEAENGKVKKYIRTIYGKGYQLVPEGFLDD